VNRASWIVHQYKFLICDDHSVVRQGLKQMLTEEFKEVTCDEARNAHEIFQKIKEQKWDLVILDINLPDKSGLDVLKELKERYPTLPVFVLSMYAEEEYAVRVLRTGASGYMTKESAPEELIAAVKKILGGGRYISLSLGERLALDLEREIEPHVLLSDREYQVMLMIASGKSLTEISDRLCLSVKSVSTYRKRIFEKTGFKNNAELIRYVIDHKLG
jgi:two-component system, NarL family, invasion response regulator UvrY